MKIKAIPEFKSFSDDEEFIPETEETSDELESLESQKIRGKLVTCKYCDGTGKVINPKNIGMLEIGSRKLPCPACKGSGYIRV